MYGAAWTDWKPRIGKLFDNDDSQVEQWRTVFCSAARYAEERGLLMFEGDEIFSFGSRWPMFD